MDIDGIQLPKASGIEKIKKDFDEFLIYWQKAKGGRPERLILATKFAQPLKKSLKAQKLLDDRLTYKQIPIVEA